MAVDLVVLDPLAVNGWVCKQTFSTEVTGTRSGAEQRVQRWVPPKRSYEIPYDVMARSPFVALRHFHRLRGGQARGFLLWDVSDFYVAAQSIGVGNGSATTFQLVVGYSDGGNAFTEPILHPVPTGTSIPVNLQGVNPGVTSAFNTIEVNSVVKTEGTDYTVSPSTGIVTFASAPGSGLAITWSGWYYIGVRFDGDDFSLELDSIYAKSNPHIVQLFGE